MWSMVLADGARRSRFAALFGKLGLRAMAGEEPMRVSEAACG